MKELLITIASVDSLGGSYMFMSATSFNNGIADGYCDLTEDGEMVLDTIEGAFEQGYIDSNEYDRVMYYDDISDMTYTKKELEDEFYNGNVLEVI